MAKELTVWAVITTKENTDGAISYPFPYVPSVEVGGLQMRTCAIFVGKEQAEQALEIIGMNTSDKSHLKVVECKISFEEA